MLVELLAKDTGFVAPVPDVWVELISASLIDGPEAAVVGFVRSAELLVPTLLDLSARTAGNFSEFAVDLYAPFFPEHPDYVREVELSLRGKVIGTRVFRNFTQRHQFIVPCSELFQECNTLALSVTALAGGTSDPPFFVKAFYLHKGRLANIQEKNSIWLFSTARSGSSWLGLDILCSGHRARPMDEPGFGRMFAPIDWIAERFYDLASKPRYFPSGLDYELRDKHRTDASIVPFERHFIYARQENQIASRQNRRLYLDLLRETVFHHVLNEWGLIGYQHILFKMPNDSHAADVIMQAFPNSFMIFLIRDGRDVMKSRFSPFASLDLAETTDMALRLYSIAFYSHWWNFQVDIIRSAFTAHAQERKLLVRYEDLRQRTAEQIAMIFLRLGTIISEEDVARLVEATSLENMAVELRGPDKPRQTGQVGRYADTFSSREIELMEQIMGPNLREFSYAVRTDAWVCAASRDLRHSARK